MNKLILSSTIVGSFILFSFIQQGSGTDPQPLISPSASAEPTFPTQPTPTTSNGSRPNTTLTPSKSNSLYPDRGFAL